MFGSVLGTLLKLGNVFNSSLFLTTTIKFLANVSRSLTTGFSEVKMCGKAQLLLGIEFQNL